MKVQIHPASRFAAWMFAGIAALSTLVGWPIAAGFFSSTPIGVVEWPSVALFVLLAFACVICFLFCPRRPLVPKIITFALMIHALFWTIDVVVYHWLHFVDYA